MSLTFSTRTATLKADSLYIVKAPLHVDCGYLVARFLRMEEDAPVFDDETVCFEIDPDHVEGWCPIE